MEKYFEINGFDLTIKDIIDVAVGKKGIVRMSDSAIEKCQNSRAQINRWLEKDAPVVYGINTGLGNLKNIKLSTDDHCKWNETIPYPHAIGLGAPIDPLITRIALLIRANVLCRGYSAVRPELIQRMLDIFNAGISPVVFELGSTGLSDLGPLAQSAMVVAGMEEAEVFYEGRRTKAKECFEALGIEPEFVLECKETLSQMNGSTMTQSISVVAFNAFKKLVEVNREILNVEGLLSRELISTQQTINQACDSALSYIHETLNFENNVSCDNPLVFEKENGFYEAVMGCNCSNTQVGFAMDLLAILVSEQGLMVNAAIFQLAEASDGLAGYCSISESLLNAIRAQCIPASADSISTKGNQEDHVEFSYGAARKAMQSVKLLKTMVAGLGSIAVLKAEQSDYQAVNDSQFLKALSKNFDLQNKTLFMSDRLNVAEDLFTSHILI
ncbi:aromatic amino acid ammonia-lyase [Acidaminobacter hydrogenoformans]|uniref:Histidine ammonia-lyase n=1 Tax=Acidaminobacter hydrogenoformans DSM 2784 TaxID=1120920 RepID=A0A1G5S1H9_9FIRM|nr:aromatic amino acid ammonia-lyase [Acidaminobacter hydrogenoformans]SCZ79581.1 Histidine ammonia-lyase [Acidaminobacter hydrogenoformans DSM 2784]